MKTLILTLGNKKSKKSLESWLDREFIQRKLNSPFGYAFLLFCALGISYIFATQGLVTAIVIAGLIIGTPMALGSMFDLKFGVILITVIAYFVLGIKRYAEQVPLGLAMDALTAIMLLGLFVKQVKERDWSFAKNPISKVVLVWMFYSIAMIANPEAPSRIAYIYVIRSMAGLMAMYFIISYAITTFRFVKYLTNTLVIVLFLAAIYGLKQQFIGFSDYETWWVVSDPLRYDLYFIWGRMRIFSFMSDPSIFGILMACGAMFCFVLAMGPYSLLRRIFLGFCSLCMLGAMVFAGTRTAYVLLPVGFFFFSFLTMRKDVLMICGLGVLLGAAYILKNPQNPTVYRIYSAFFPGKDESYQVREENQKFIQPYIQSHPIGGGLGSTGVWGARFSPHHFLAKFPPDSGYVMIAVEMGWLGLLVYCCMLYIAFREGVKRYFRARSDIIKNYYSAYLILLIGMTIANFAQLVFMQTPGNLTFFIILAVLARLIEVEPALLAKHQAKIEPAPATSTSQQLKIDKNN